MEVRDLMDRLAEVAPNVAIVSGDFAFVSLDDLREHRGTRVSQLELVAGPDEEWTDERIAWVMFERGYLTVHVTGTEVAGYRLRDAVRALVLRTPWYTRFGLWSVIGIGSLVASLIVGLRAGPWLGFGLVALSLTGSTLAFLFERHRVKTTRKVSLAPPHDSGLLQRNRDLVLVIVSAVLGGVVTKALDLAFKERPEPNVISSPAARRATPPAGR
jgi:hypothetical protein